MKLAMVGYGELGRQILALVAADRPPEQIYYFDDLALREGRESALPFSVYPEARFSDCDFYVCLGYKHLQVKSKIIDHLLGLQRRLPAYIAPSSYVSRSAMLGYGTVLYPMCNVDRAVRIGNGVLVNNSVTISHDSVIGDCCYLSPGTTLSGFVTIGSQTFVGAGAVIAHNIKIGSNVIIGIGTVVTQDIPSGASVIGNPMKILKKPLRIE